MLGYTKEHTWVRVDAGEAVIGITNFSGSAQGIFYQTITGLVAGHQYLVSGWGKVGNGDLGGGVPDVGDRTGGDAYRLRGPSQGGHAD